MSRTMTDADVITAIRRHHLKANIAAWEGYRYTHWNRATVDSGGTIFGPGPYVKLPITLRHRGRVVDELVIRVYPPERLRRRLAAAWKRRAPPPGEP